MFYCKKFVRHLTPLVCCLLLGTVPLDALETAKGRLRLTLHEQSGRFSLYGRNANGLFEPFFSDTDPRTSFIEVSVNGTVYRLGDSRAFQFRVDSQGDSPALVFENDSLQVREEFSFIKTAGSAEVNGVQINIRLKNRQSSALGGGLRVLLDTSLGEGIERIPFCIDEQNILSEMHIDGHIDNRWVSRGITLSLMGSIGLAGSASLSGKNPDYLHFADRNRLNEAFRRTSFGVRRNFTAPAYSYPDTAACYYYSFVSLPQHGEVLYTILLAAEDSAGFWPSVTPNRVPAGIDDKEADLSLLRGLIDRLDQYLDNKIELTREELTSIEQEITRIKTRYNLP